MWREPCWVRAASLTRLAPQPACLPGTIPVYVIRAIRAGRILPCSRATDAEQSRHFVTSGNRLRPASHTLRVKYESANELAPCGCREECRVDDVRARDRACGRRTNGNCAAGVA